MVARSRVHGYHGSLKRSSIAITAWGAVGGGLTGLILGLAGDAAGPPARLVVTLAVGCLTLRQAARGARPWQLDAETPLAWLEYEDMRTSMLNGATLGAGLMTRVGYWAVYAVPLLAWASGEPVAGAAVYAVYGGCRVGLGAAVRARRALARRPERLRALALRMDGLVLSLSVGVAGASIWSTWR